VILCYDLGGGGGVVNHGIKMQFLRYNHSWYLEGQLSRDLDLIGLWGK